MTRERIKVSILIHSQAATVGVLYKKVFLKTSQTS